MTCSSTAQVKNGRCFVSSPTTLLDLTLKLTTFRRPRIYSPTLGVEIDLDWSTGTSLVYVNYRLALCDSTVSPVSSGSCSVRQSRELKHLVTPWDRVRQVRIHHGARPADRLSGAILVGAHTCQPNRHLHCAYMHRLSTLFIGRCRFFMAEQMGNSSGESGIQRRTSLRIGSHVTRLALTSRSKEGAAEELGSRLRGV